MAINKVNLSAYERGEQYLNELNDEANRNLQILLLLMSSFFTSTIDGPNYARELKAMSIELARLRLALDEIRTDTHYRTTRGEFLFQVLTKLLFPERAPETGFVESELRDFLNNLIPIYFQGSVPESIQEAVELLTEQAEVRVTANFEQARLPGSKFDISDQFGFQIDVFLDTPSDIDTILADKNIRILLDILRPAHTLLRLRYILSDEYIGNQTDTQANKVLDSFKMALDCYNYEDFRKFVEGVEGVNTLGTKKAVSVVAEDHSADF